MSYRDRACLKQLHFDHSAATLEYHVAHTAHDSQRSHSIRTESTSCRTIRWSLMWNVTLKATTTYFDVLGLIRPRTHFPDFPYTKWTVYNNAIVVAYGEEIGIKSPPPPVSKKNLPTNRNRISYLLTLDYVYELSLDYLWNTAPIPVTCKSNALSARPGLLLLEPQVESDVTTVGLWFKILSSPGC